MDELRDSTGNDRALDDLERDILGAVRGVVTDFVAKRVGRPDLSDVDLDIELPSEAVRQEPGQHAAQEAQEAGPEETPAPPGRRFGPGTALLPLLLIFSFGVLVVGAGWFYNHVIVGDIPLVDGVKLQSVAIEQQRSASKKATAEQSTLTGSIAEVPATIPVSAAEQQVAPAVRTVGGWVTTTTPSGETRLGEFSAARPVERD